ncbi:SIMPL domain-containing protein [Microbacter sp. GSS18]|nr:SIMPL domain-containing protein [Microbacter sp. GSS18]
MADVVITVRGRHETRIAPERASAHLSVRAESRDRGAVVERIAALAEPVRADLGARKEAGSVVEWASQRVSLWTDRPWGPDGKRQAPVHHASVDVVATFSDFAAMSWWVGDVLDRDGVELSRIDWQLTPATRARVEQEVATEAVGVAVARATAYATALGLASVVPVEIADLGLLADHPPEGPQPAMARAVALAAAPGGGPVTAFEPEDIVVEAGVEARFTAH